VPPAPDSPARALDGRAIVVIGGTSGIGLSGARALADAGARVVALGLPSSAAAARDALAEHAIIIEGDATDAASVDGAIDHAVRAAPSCRSI